MCSPCDRRAMRLCVRWILLRRQCGAVFTRDAEAFRFVGHIAKGCGRSHDAITFTTIPGTCSTDRQMCGLHSCCASFKEASNSATTQQAQASNSVTAQHVAVSKSTTPQHAKSLYMFIKWGLIISLTSSSFGLAMVWWELRELQQKMDAVWSVWEPETPTLCPEPKHQYWWQPTPDHDNTFHQIPLPCPSSGGENPLNLCYQWLRSRSEDPFVLLDVCKSESQAVRMMGVKALAEKTNWQDFQYRYVAQSADVRTLVGLARTRGADQRFFLPMPALLPPETSAAEELASLLLTMDEHQHKLGGPTTHLHNASRQKLVNDSATARALHLVQHRHSARDDMRPFWGFDGSVVDVASVDGPLPEDQLLLEFLAAVANLCCFKEQALLFIKRQGLSVLQRLTETRPSLETLTAVAAVLGNLALHPSSHYPIVHTGWLGQLKIWLESCSSGLAVAAGRALLNMDTDWCTHRLEDGIVQLHPLHRSERFIQADLVLVHGLLGGAVRTWRQQDCTELNFLKAKPSAPKEQPKTGKGQKVPDCQAAKDGAKPTDCWPKDWLAKDCPNIRILSIHYNTSLTTWSKHASTNRFNTLRWRSQELMEKLANAGVGQRPVIWSGHSMGGLLIKQMLALADSSGHSALKDSTCGLLLFSVPHRGLPLVTVTSSMHKLLQPSTELQELSADSQHLRTLQEGFQRWVSTNNIPCLSFGETLKTRYRKTLPKFMVVPPHSSNPGVGEFVLMPLNHVNICKPNSTDSDLYQRSLAFIQQAIIFSYLSRLKSVLSLPND